MRKIIVGALALLASVVAANATPITGTYSVTTNNGATVTNLLSDPFNINLVLNVGQTFNLANVFQNADGTSQVTASFHFTAPSALNDIILAADVFSTPGASKHDALTWQSGGLLTENFSDGSIVNIALADITSNGNSYTGLNIPITFTLTRAATPPVGVPEPLTLSLFGAGLAGAAALRRRRKAKTA